MIIMIIMETNVSIDAKKRSHESGMVTVPFTYWYQWYSNINIWDHAFRHATQQAKFVTLILLLQTFASQSMLPNLLLQQFSWTHIEQVTPKNSMILVSSCIEYLISHKLGLLNHIFSSDTFLLTMILSISAFNHSTRKPTAKAHFNNLNCTNWTK